MTKRIKDVVAGRDGDLRAREMLVLLVSLVFMLLFVPLVDAYVETDVFRPLGMTLVSAVIVWTVRRHGIELRVAVVFMVVLIPVLWASLFLNNRIFFAAGTLMAAVFFLSAAIRILDRVFRQHLKTFQAVWGAIGGYLLLGLSWAMLYWTLICFDETAIVFPHADPAVAGSWHPPVLLSQVVYFSFVTMSTLGYGDVAPVAPLAQTACWMQAVVGQFYIAIFVARLVGMLPRPQ